MRTKFLKLWHDEGGALISVEWVFVATILVIGITTGLVAVRNAVNNELTEFSTAVSALCQDYSFTGTSVESECSGCNSCKIASTCGTSVRGDSATQYNLQSNSNSVCAVNPDDCPCN